MYNLHVSLDVCYTALQVVNFIDDEYNMCLSIENQASCSSSQQNSTINNPLSTVCAWQNAFLQTCWSGGSDASHDQGWIYDNSTKQLVLAVDVNQNVCLEICTDDSFARGSCSLVDNNVGAALLLSASSRGDVLASLQQVNLRWHAKPS